MPGVTETYPEFTMVGADFETARGPWGVRGEVAGFVKDSLQSDVLARGIAGRTWQGGVGVDRKTRSIALSIKAKEIEEEKDSVKEHNSKSSNVTPATVGDLIKAKMNKE